MRDVSEMGHASRSRRQSRIKWCLHELGSLSQMRRVYAKALYMDDAATLDDVREAVTTLEDAARIARRVLGVAHPTTTGIEDNLRMARAKLPAQSKN